MTFEEFCKLDNGQRPGLIDRGNHTCEERLYEKNYQGDTFLELYDHTHLMLREFEYNLWHAPEAHAALQEAIFDDREEKGVADVDPLDDWMRYCEHFDGNVPNKEECLKPFADAIASAINLYERAVRGIFFNTWEVETEGRFAEIMTLMDPEWREPTKGPIFT